MNPKFDTVEPVNPFALNSDFVLREYHTNGIHTTLGAYGEKYVKNLLINSGYLCDFQGVARFSGDLWTTDKHTGELCNVEVKTAYESYRGTFSFCLRKTYHTSIAYSDFVTLLCIDKFCNHFLYVIPCGLLFYTALTITSHPTKYAGKYSPFRMRNRINFDVTRTVAELW